MTECLQNGGRGELLSGSELSSGIRDFSAAKVQKQSNVFAGGGEVVYELHFVCPQQGAASLYFRRSVHLLPVRRQ